MSKEEIDNIGFKSVGENVFISRHASIYSAGEMEIGNYVRIDDFCILSGKIKIGNYVHIAAFDALYGGDSGIYIGDYSTISSHSSVYSISDDYSGKTMTNPMIPADFKNVTSEKVIIAEHVIIGSHTVILPGSVVNKGCAIGAMSLIKDCLAEWGIYAGIPCKKIQERERLLLQLQNEFERI